MKDEHPTLAALTDVLSELLNLPESDPSRASAIAKVKAQIETVKSMSGAAE